MDRRKKIEFLFGVLKGTRSISELIPIKIQDWFVDDRGLYLQAETNERLTYAELKIRHELDPITLRIIHVRTDIPIAESEEAVIM